MRHGPLLIIVIFLFIGCVSPAVPAFATNFGGYTVEPVTPGMDTGTPLETKAISFWELPIQVMILSVAFSISPVIGFPVELLLFTKLYVYLGFRKISRFNILDNTLRNQIYTSVQANPGILFGELSQETGVSRGTLKYHLALLRMAGKISLLDTCGHSRYFENSGKYSPLEQTVIRYCKNPVDRSILEFFITVPRVLPEGSGRITRSVRTNGHLAHATVTRRKYYSYSCQREACQI